MELHSNIKHSSSPKASKGKKLIIFDYDGVIVDSYPSVFEAYKVIAKKMNMWIPKTFEEFMAIHRDDYLKCFEKMGIKTKEEISTAHYIFADEMLKQDPPLFAGIKDALEGLSVKYVVALISANNHREITIKLKTGKINNHFEYIYAKDNDIHRHVQKENAIEHLIESLEVSKENVLMIGDRNCDYNASKNSGIEKVLLVNYGWGFDKEKTPGRINFEVNEPKDILKALKKINF